MRASRIGGAWRRTLAAATTTALAIGLIGAGAAHATVSVSVTGGVLTVTGSNGPDEPQFNYYPGGGMQPTGYTRVWDSSGGVVDPSPPCYRPAPDPEGQPVGNVALCEDGGDKPLITSLVVNLDAGNDHPGVQECFDSVTIDAGEGNNQTRVPACDTGSFSFTSGAGQDNLTADPPGSGSTARIAITGNLGGGDDEFFGGEGPSVVHGGGGNDYLVGAAGNDTLFGDDGNDTFLGHAGNDKYDGGAGDDVIGLTKGVTNDDDPGDDDYRGGTGSDTLVLDGHAAGMAISIDEIANDGSSGEADNVHNDIELIRATNKNDVFNGGPGVDKFEGNAGDDTIHGGAGDDDLYGGGGDDKVYGDDGNDKVQGANGADTVDGGSGTDQIYGDIGACSISCSFDADVLLARDGQRDAVDCGGGADTAQVDPLDVVAFCASVDTKNVDGSQTGGTPLTPPAAAGPTFTVGKAKELSIGKGVRVTVKCPGACSFTVSVVLSAKTARSYGLGRKSITVGTVRGALLKAGSKKVTVKLSRKARAKLRHAKKVAATLKVSVKDAAGKRTAKSKSVKLGS